MVNLDPNQMLDSELDEAIAKQKYLFELDKHQTRVLFEFNRRIDVIQDKK